MRERALVVGIEFDSLRRNHKRHFEK